MRKWWREPLVHFILIGALLFVGHHFWAKHISKGDYTIFVSEAEIQRQAQIFASENQRQPTDEDIQGLIFAHVEEQILMREAERLGLDADDTIIRRRLAQKMRFMINEDTPPALPNEAALKDWFEDNTALFVQPEQRAFTHVYFSPGEHADVDTAARTALGAITNDNWKSMGDPFIESNTLGLIDAPGLTRKYGKNFTDNLFALPPDARWQGPIASAFGMHLVRIDDYRTKDTPDYEQVRPQVKKVWQEKTLRATNEQRLVDLLKKYKVEVEGVDP